MNTYRPKDAAIFSSHTQGQDASKICHPYSDLGISDLVDATANAFGTACNPLIHSLC